jgi:hypothetical protein
MDVPKILGTKAEKVVVENADPHEAVPGKPIVE